MPGQVRYVIGIDGGGTKTDALITGLDGTIVAECHGGPSHLGNVGISHAADVLFDLISDCCTKAECSPEALQNIVLGIAGAGRGSDRAELVNAILAVGLKKKFPLKNIVVETDARVALEAALAGKPGLVVIGGTGSIALYRTDSGVILRAGGWGSVLGDEGGGFAIARDAINAVMRQHDGRFEKTLLTAKALKHFNVASPDELISKIYHDHADLAAFAPSVLEAVVERDRIAHNVIVKNANELVELVRVLTMQARPKMKLPVVPMGRLLETDNVYAKMVREKIASSLPQIVIQKPKFPAAFGAAILGLNAFR
ncbi:MAG TPA: BadF/BadG/BcrA/BcrD ATPase family protein [Bacteroidota bacterium]|jgi:N-acetylglucosamine kinase-like BadF-type ATPase